MNIAVILAGGSGTRMNNHSPKQFIEINNKPIIEFSIEAFEINDNINEIAIVSNESCTDKVYSIINNNGYKKINKVINGGKERYLSSFAAITAYQDYPDDTNIIFHDCARPLISQKTINEVIDALNFHNSVAVAIPATDTVFKLDDCLHFIDNIPNRSYLFQAQTPQAFKLSLIKKAYKLALNDTSFAATDDCGIIAKYLPNEKIFIVIGEKSNMKITYAQDIILAEAILKDINK
ncbi:MAG: IspD/TarI family cytidylyltransferase [Bacteroidales bacterium]|jgi:ribitol-5-phosphate 2-dehydrogenase (NADP+) / D-ribitol-5-phosphate cytidylyltransferase|nr:2-C-methyl-D-erythritol 4-phosphate cytidylyltransferase [Bacteroidales bacterium]MDD2204286.1 IspD/TarI family cytidylyltransferase [Bacteroidales bacterium]MDD3151339.1 IspD/TarI family cytidylyltransferase [Bacteroidales bacterium]MDD3913167.1 IspD/TarI family cytidylyltransferase [Bacteroidales bacterium]MDD4633082.1 IspD/TarI family cytidylyltransferase [Bacteroidales bacterium]